MRLIRWYGGLLLAVSSPVAAILAGIGSNFDLVAVLRHGIPVTLYASALYLCARLVWFSLVGMREGPHATRTEAWRRT